eukprot:CAMPEP_0183331910 /NCGR_PEP_ID=MMETSP0164_2-20130417/1207_1 /TAXON_ID=221442 /ORGANISM="Coccolithus pelagicus ssp braarudi, Strain PLY182g" /LENGTH=41 /DNA_ID= /DNA_START= /DNA_END= /DNA_ORIENTATION=
MVCAIGSTTLQINGGATERATRECTTHVVRAGVGSVGKQRL